MTRPIPPEALQEIAALRQARISTDARPAHDPSPTAPTYGRSARPTLHLPHPDAPRAQPIQALPA